MRMNPNSSLLDQSRPAGLGTQPRAASTPEPWPNSHLSYDAPAPTSRQGLCNATAGGERTLRGNAYPAPRTLVARSASKRAMNPAKLAARLSGADRAALWIVRWQTPLTCIWSRGFAHNGLERERSFIEHLRHTEDILSGRPRTVRRESINSYLPAPKEQARAGGWRFTTLWPIHKKNRLFGIVVCYFDGAIPPNRNRVKHIQAVLTRDSFAWSDPPSQTSSLSLISQRRSPGNLTLTCRAQDPATKICELTLDAIRFALRFWKGAMVAVGRCERSSFHIVAASGALEDQVGARYPSLGILMRAWESKRTNCDRSSAICLSPHLRYRSRWGRPRANGFSWLRSGLGNGCWAHLSPSQAKKRTTRWAAPAYFRGLQT